MTLLVALLLAILASVIIVYGVTLIISAFAGDVRSWPDRFRLQRRLKLLPQFDQTVLNASPSQSLALLRRSLFLDGLWSGPALIPKICELHDEVLARLLSLLERFNHRATNLSKIESLLDERATLLQGVSELDDFRRSLERKRKERGRDVPSWALQEHDNKRGEIRDKLRENKKAIEQGLDELDALFRSPTSHNEVTYH